MARCDYYKLKSDLYNSWWKASPGKLIEIFREKCDLEDLNTVAMLLTDSLANAAMTLSKHNLDAPDVLAKEAFKVEHIREKLYAVNVVTKELLDKKRNGKNENRIQLL